MIQKKNRPTSKDSVTEIHLWVAPVAQNGLVLMSEKSMRLAPCKTAVLRPCHLAMHLYCSPRKWQGRSAELGSNCSHVMNLVLLSRGQIEENPGAVHQIHCLAPFWWHSTRPRAPANRGLARASGRFIHAKLTKALMLKCKLCLTSSTAAC